MSEDGDHFGHILRVIEILELSHRYIRVRTMNRVKVGLRYNLPLTVPIAKGCDPIEIEVAGVVAEASWNEEDKTCTFKLVNLDLEALYQLDSWDVYDEIVYWWNDQHEPSVAMNEAKDTAVIYSEKYKKFKEIKEKMDLLRLFGKRRKY